jgi:hypothetical protein
VAKPYRQLDLLESELLAAEGGEETCYQPTC